MFGGLRGVVHARFGYVHATFGSQTLVYTLKRGKYQTKTGFRQRALAPLSVIIILSIATTCSSEPCTKGVKPTVGPLTARVQDGFTVQ